MEVVISHLCWPQGASVLPLLQFWLLVLACNQPIIDVGYWCQTDELKFNFQLTLILGRVSNLD